MKRIFMLFTLGVIGAFAFAKIAQKREPFHFLAENDKNFGAFPPEIPEHQFDDMFI